MNAAAAGMFAAGSDGCIATHEAAHAVIATVLGVPFARVTLRPTEPGMRGAVYGLLPTKAPSSAIATVLLAGVTGELAVWTPSPGADLVAVAAEAAALAVCNGYIDIESLARHAPDIGDLQDVVHGLIHGHRHAIGAVAAALLVHPRQTLTEAEVHRIVRRPAVIRTAARPHPLGRQVSR